MKPGELEEGDIVQISPTGCFKRLFAGCLMVVTEPTSLGAHGYVQLTGGPQSAGGVAFYRAVWSEMEPTGGKAAWVRNFDAEPRPLGRGYGQRDPDAFKRREPGGTGARM